MDLFNLIRAPNPTKVKTCSRPRAAHEVPPLTVTANRSTGPQDQEAAAPEVSPPENITTTGIAPEAGPAERVAARGPLASTRGGKSLDAIELGMGSTRLIPAPQGAPVDVSNPDPLSFADPQSRPSADVAQKRMRLKRDKSEQKRTKSGTKR
nr:hypothetical protein [Tanacetum cinerariifolium]